MAFGFNENSQEPENIENAILSELKKIYQVMERMQKDVEMIKDDVDRMAHK